MDRCTGCGLVIAGGTEGCQAVFDERLAQDFSDATYFRVHRLLVDTYCLQHPDRYCASFKSLAAHLMGVCWSLEHDGGHAVPSEPIRRWVERHPHMTKPEIPSARGAMTIADVASAADAVEHGRRVLEWARSTWKAYTPLHALARQWVQFALDDPARALVRRPSRRQLR